MRLLRPLRVLPFTGAHLDLLALPVYQQFGTTRFREDLFHHLSHPHYLRRGLAVRERIGYILDHYTAESRHWHHSYHHHVYAGPGLQLWRHDTDGPVFTITLTAASPTRGSLYEGELKLTLRVDDLPLHQMNFSLINHPTLHTPVPFIGRTQGAGNWHPEARAAFDHHFRQNSASYFCFAALAGIARTIGAPAIIGVRADEQVFTTPADAARFHRNYNDFWKALGGTDHGGLGYYIPLPDYDRPVHNKSASHRRRARKRRKHWAAIDTATIHALQPHLPQPA
jgi:uncharacterized protein VirK/YbjX